MTSTKRTFSEALRLLESLYYTGVKFGLENTLQMLERVGNPHRDLRCIHVAGTNGKGSVCAMLAAALQSSGYRVGLYSSPHLIDVRERFRVDGKVIPRNEFAELVFSLYERTERLFSGAATHRPTFFEFTTVLALLYFRRVHVDFAIMEVGMGGRLDATNVVHPILAVITTVGYDHTEFLGSQRIQIAREKGGIVKENVPVICGERDRSVQSVIHDICALKNAPAYYIQTDYDADIWRVIPTGRGMRQQNRVRWQERQFMIDAHLLGRHQNQNVAISCAAIQVLARSMPRLDSDQALAGIRRARWPARLQRLPGGVLLDAAHNGDGMRECVESLDILSPGVRWHVVFAVLADKNWDVMVQLLAPRAQSITLVPLPHDRSENPRKIFDHIRQEFPGTPVELCADVATAYATITARGSGLIIGSLYLAGAVLSLFRDSRLLQVYSAR